MGIQAYQVPMTGSPRGLDPTMQGIANKEDCILTTRENQVLQAKTQQHERLLFDKPIQEHLDSRLSNLKAWIKHLLRTAVVQKGIQDAHKQYVSLPRQEYSDPQYN
jgi:hypothetical protein